MKFMYIFYGHTVLLCLVFGFSHTMGTPKVMDGDKCVHQSEERLSMYCDENTKKNSMRSSGVSLIIHSKARFKNNMRMDKKLYVHDQAYFHDDVSIKGNANIEKNLIIKGNLVVEGNISIIDTVSSAVTITNLSVTDTLTTNNYNVVNQTVAGTLSVTDMVIDNNVSVGCNVNLRNSTVVDSVSVGNVYKGGKRFIHNTGIDNTFVGIEAGNFGVTGSRNTGIGAAALQNNIAGSNNTAFGTRALSANTIGNRNTASGNNALQNNISGSNNTAVGSNALMANEEGSFNTAIGFGAFRSNISGSFNVVIGDNAAAFATGGLDNVIIGSSTATSNFLNGTGNIYIGAVQPQSASESDVIRIGADPHVSAVFIAGIHGKTVDSATAVPVFISDINALGTILSSQKFKRDMVKMKDESICIYGFNPVTFVYDQDPTETQQYGLIAEEVAQVFPALVINKRDGTPLTVRYDILPVLLFNEMKKQQQMMDQLNKKIEIIESLENKANVIEDLNNQIQAFYNACNNLRELADLFSVRN